MSPIPNEVFLSHATADRPFATRLAGVLRRHGIPVWYSITNIRGSQQWHDEIGAALHRCDWLVLVLSPNAVASKWVRRELIFCLQEDRYDDRIAPLLHRPCDYGELSWTLPSIQRVDFQRDFHQGCRDLLRIWGLGYDVPART